MYGGMCSGSYTKALNELSMVCAAHGIAIQFYFIMNESLIQRARNYCVDEFLRSECTHMLFIDADIEFGFRDVLTLLHLCDDNNGFDVVCGPYPKKAISYEKLMKAATSGIVTNPFDLENYIGDYVFNLANGVTSFKLDEPVEVMEAGTGFMMMNRSTLERYAKAYPHNYYRPDHVRSAAFDGSREIYAYFDCEIDKDRSETELMELLDVIQISETLEELAVLKEQVADIKAREANSTKRYLSEDYLFCQNVRKAGMKVWLCPWMQLSHMGTFIFKGSLPHLAAIDASPTATDESRKSYYDK
jgi:hypothetical protein